jgi:hypothetical protein
MTERMVNDRPGTSRGRAVVAELQRLPASAEAWKKWKRSGQARIDLHQIWLLAGHGMVGFGRPAASQIDVTGGM